MINFGDLTKIKFQETAQVSSSYGIPNGPPGAECEVFGNPDLKNGKEIIL
ncbi:MAG: hypothetical protein IPI04_12795 [Ignavibacteria bacterium]|nr:hypothetical protein [Ignavibacteria bacterium]